MPNNVGSVSSASLTTNSPRLANHSIENRTQQAQDNKTQSLATRLFSRLGNLFALFRSLVPNFILKKFESPEEREAKEERRIKFAINPDNRSPSAFSATL